MTDGRFLGEMGQTEGDEDDHPDANVNLATTIPVLEDSTGGIDVVWGDDEILHEIVVPEGKSDGGVDETGSITGEATLMRDVGGHFTERNHDEVTNETEEAVAEEETEGSASTGLGFELERRGLATERKLTERALSRIR